VQLAGPCAGADARHRKPRLSAGAGHHDLHRHPRRPRESGHRPRERGHRPTDSILMGAIVSRRARLQTRWRAIARPWREGAGFQSKFLVIMGATITGAFVLMSIIAPLLATDDPQQISGDYHQGPSWRHPFG